MAKLKRKKGLRDVTGDGKFTYADVLRMRGVKPKKSMGRGGGVYVPMPEMAPLPMRPINISGNPASSSRLQKDFRDQVYRMFDEADMGLRPEPTQADIDAIDRVPNRSKQFALVDREYIGGLKEKPFIERKSDIIRERDARGLMNPMRYDIPEDMEPLKPRKPGEIMAYGGKVKLMKKGGTVEYGLGGAIMAGINAIKNKEGLVGGLKNVAKAYATPGSGIAQGAKFAGGMLANSNNPALAGIGKVAGMASNFMPGGGGVAGMMPALQGLFSQKQGGMVPVKLKYASGGMAVPEGEKGKEGEIPGLDVTSQPVMIGFDRETQTPIMDQATQVYIDGLPVSGREAAAFINEKSEGMVGQGGFSVADALMAAQDRRSREKHGRDRLGKGMYRMTAEEELLRDQKAAGTKALLKRLNEYDGGNIRRTKSY